MADGFNLATAWVQIVPTTEGIGGQIQQALAPEASSAGDAAGESAGSNFVNKLKGVLIGGAIAATVKGAFDSVSNAINDFASAGDTIDKQSQKLGVTAEQYQALDFAAGHCGFSTSTFTTAVKKLQQSGYEGTIMDYLDGLMALEDPAERAAAAQEMLGEKVANEIAPYLNGSQSMSEYQTQLESLGGMMSGESVLAAAAYEDALADMQVAMQGVKRGMVADLLPGVTSVMNGIAAVASGDESGFEAIKNGANDLIVNLGEYAGKMWENGLSMVTMLGRGIIENVPTIIDTGLNMVGSLVTSIVDSLPSVIQSGTNAVLSFLDGIGKGDNKLLTKGIGILGKLVSGIIQNLPALGKAALQIIAKLLATIASNLPQILQSGLTLAGKLISGIISFIPQIPGKIMGIITSIKNTFQNYNWAGIGKAIIDGIKNGLLNAAGAIADAAKSAAKKALDAAKNMLGIHSPSRVFRDQIGKNIALGWAEGITGSESAVRNAMNGLVDSSIGSANISMGIRSASMNMANTGDSTVVELLRRIADKDTNLYVGERNLTRSLEDMGVQFA